MKMFYSMKIVSFRYIIQITFFSLKGVLEEDRVIFST